MNAIPASTPGPDATVPEQATRLRFHWHAATAIGITVLQQGIGWFRHALIAAFFGLTRQFDSYLVVYALVSMFVFNLSAVFDTVAVSRLVQARERDGEAAFWRASNRLLLLSLLGGVVFAAVAIGLLWATTPIITAGFSEPERDFVRFLGWHFVPWMIVIVPYYALSAHLKAVWRFSWVFGAEVVVMLASIAVLWLRHTDVSDLPLAYGAGYAAGFAMLALRRGWRSAAPVDASAAILPGMTKQYLAMQLGNAAGFADRYFQSFLAGGGISALGYSGLIVNNLSSLLTFREIYVVPLASDVRRGDKLERILQGLVFISIPCAIFLLVYAHPIIKVLLERGRFDAHAAVVTALVLQIQAPSLLLSTLTTPLERMFQILDRISLVQLRYLASLTAGVVLQYLFVFQLHMDVRGVAWAGLCTSSITLCVVIVLIRRCGLMLNWAGVVKNGLLAFAIAAPGAGLSLLAATHFQGLLALAVGGAIYGIVVGGSYLALHKRLRAIIG